MTIPRLMVLVDADGSVQVFTDTPGVQVLVVDRRVEELAALAVEGAPAAALSLVGGLPQLAPARVADAFTEIAPQLERAAASIDVPQKERTRVANVKKAWFGG